MGNALKACLSDSEFPLERRQAVLRAIRKEEKVVKKKISAALVFAIVLTLVVGGAALAANLGVFGQSVNDQQNEQSVGRLEKLENASATYNDTQAAQAPEQTATEAPKTVYDELMASLYNRRFNLTLNQAYFDGYKLYYSYTLTSDCKTGFITGDGMPTGFEKWDDTQEGKFVGHYSLYDDNMNQEVVTYFSAHPKGYIAFESMGVGDGAAMNGKPLMILDSGSEMVNEYTIQGYQEVEMPDGFEPTDEIEIEMSILYGMSVYCQDENNVYFSHLMTPENRGIFRLPFKVNLNGQTEAYTGSVTTSAYMVVIHCHIGRLVDGRHFMLCGSRLIMLGLGCYTQLPQLDIDIMHETTDTLTDNTEIVVIHLLSLGGGSTEQGSSGENNIFTLQSLGRIYQEIFLLRANGRQYFGSFCIAEQADDTDRLLAQSLHGTK